MSPGDRIEVRQIRALGRHGALVGEQDQPQPFEIDLDIYLDLDTAVATDDLSDTADYGQLTLHVVEVVATTQFALLEALAGAIADAVLADVRVRSVEVSLRKLRPPVPANVATVGVRLRRVQDQPARSA